MQGLGNINGPFRVFMESTTPSGGEYELRDREYTNLLQFFRDILGWTSSASRERSLANFFNGHVEGSEANIYFQAGDKIFDAKQVFAAIADTRDALGGREASLNSSLRRWNQYFKQHLGVGLLGSEQSRDNYLFRIGNQMATVLGTQRVGQRTLELPDVLQEQQFLDSDSAPMNDVIQRAKRVLSDRRNDVIEVIRTNPVCRIAFGSTYCMHPGEVIDFYMQLSCVYWCFELYFNPNPLLTFIRECLNEKEVPGNLSIGGTGKHAGKCMPRKIKVACPATNRVGTDVNFNRLPYEMWVLMNDGVTGDTGIEQTREPVTIVQLNKLVTALDLVVLIVRPNEFSNLLKVINAATRRDTGEWKPHQFRVNVMENPDGALESAMENPNRSFTAYSLLCNPCIGSDANGHRRYVNMILKVTGLHLVTSHVSVVMNYDTASKALARRDAWIKPHTTSALYANITNQQQVAEQFMETEGRDNWVKPDPFSAVKYNTVVNVVDPNVCQNGLLNTLAYISTVAEFDRWFRSLTLGFALFRATVRGIEEDFQERHQDVWTAVCNSIPEEGRRTGQSLVNARRRAYETQIKVHARAHLRFYYNAVSLLLNKVGSVVKIHRGLFGNVEFVRRILNFPGLDVRYIPVIESAQHITMANVMSFMVAHMINSAGNFYGQDDVLSIEHFTPGVSGRKLLFESISQIGAEGRKDVRHMDSIHSFSLSIQHSQGFGDCTPRSFFIEITHGDGSSYCGMREVLTNDICFVKGLPATAVDMSLVEETPVDALLFAVGSKTSKLPFRERFDKLIKDVVAANKENPDIAMVQVNGEHGPTPALFEKYRLPVYLKAIINTNLFAEAIKLDAFTKPFTTANGLRKPFFKRIVDIFSEYQNPATENSSFLYPSLYEPMLPFWTINGEARHTQTGDVRKSLDTYGEEEMVLYDCAKHYLTLLTGGGNRQMYSDVFGHSPNYGGLHNADTVQLFTHQASQNCGCSADPERCPTIVYHTADCLKATNSLDDVLLSYVADFGYVYLDSDAFEAEYGCLLGGLFDEGTTWRGLLDKAQHRYVDSSTFLNMCYQAFFMFSGNSGLMVKDGHLYTKGNAEYDELLRFMWHVQRGLFGVQMGQFDFVHPVRMGLRKWMEGGGTLEQATIFAEEVTAAVEARFILPKRNVFYVQDTSNGNSTSGMVDGLLIGKEMRGFKSGHREPGPYKHAERRTAMIQRCFGYSVHKLYDALPEFVCADKGVLNDPFRAGQSVTRSKYVNNQVRTMLGSTKYTTPQAIHVRSMPDMLNVEPIAFNEDGTVDENLVNARLNDQIVEVLRPASAAKSVGLVEAKGPVVRSAMGNFYLMTGCLPLLTNILLLNAVEVRGIVERGGLAPLRTMIMGMSATLLNTVACTVPVLRTRTDSVLVQAKYAEQVETLLKDMLWDQSDWTDIPVVDGGGAEAAEDYRQLQEILGLQEEEEDLEPYYRFAFSELPWIAHTDPNQVGPLAGVDADFQLPGHGSCFSSTPIHLRGDLESMAISPKAKEMSGIIRREMQVNSRPSPLGRSDETCVETQFVEKASRPVVEIKDSELFQHWVFSSWAKVEKVLADNMNQLDIDSGSLRGKDGREIHDLLIKFYADCEDIRSLYEMYTTYSAYYVVRHLGPCIIEGEPGSGKSTRVKEMVRQLLMLLRMEDNRSIVEDYESRGLNNLPGTDNAMEAFTAQKGAHTLKQVYSSDGIGRALDPGSDGQPRDVAFNTCKGEVPRDLFNGRPLEMYDEAETRKRYQIAVIGPMHAPLRTFKELARDPLVYVGTIHSFFGVNINVKSLCRNPPMTMGMHRRLRPELSAVKYVFVDEAEMLAKEFEAFLEYCNRIGMQVWIIGDPYQTSNSYGRCFQMRGAVAKFLSRSIVFEHDLQFRAVGGSMSKLLGDILTTGNLEKYFTDICVPTDEAEFAQDYSGHFKRLFRVRKYIHFKGMHSINTLHTRYPNRIRAAAMQKQDLSKDDGVEQLDAKLWRIAIAIANGEPPDMLISCQNWKVIAMVWLEVERRVALLVSKYNRGASNEVVIYRTVRMDWPERFRAQDLVVRNLTMAAENEKEKLKGAFYTHGLYPSEKLVHEYMKTMSKGDHGVVKASEGNGAYWEFRSFNHPADRNGPEQRKTLHGLPLRFIPGHAYIVIERFRSKFVNPGRRVAQYPETMRTRPPSDASDGVGLCAPDNFGSGHTFAQMSSVRYLGCEKWVAVIDNPFYVESDTELRAIAERCHVRHTAIGNNQKVKEVINVMRFRDDSSDEVLYMTEMEASMYLMPSYVCLSTFVIGMTLTSKLTVLQVSRRAGRNFAHGYESLYEHASMLSERLGVYSTSSEFGRMLRVYFTRMRDIMNFAAIDLDVADVRYWMHHVFCKLPRPEFTADCRSLTMENPKAHVYGVPDIQKGLGEREAFASAMVSTILGQRHISYAIPFQSPRFAALANVTEMRRVKHNPHIVVDGYIMQFSDLSNVTHSSGPVLRNVHMMAKRRVTALVRDKRLSVAYADGPEPCLFSFPTSKQFSAYSDTAVLTKVLFHPAVMVDNHLCMPHVPTAAMKEVSRLHEWDILDLDDIPRGGGGDTPDTTLVSEICTQEEISGESSKRDSNAMPSQETVTPTPKRRRVAEEEENLQVMLVNTFQDCAVWLDKNPFQNQVLAGGFVSVCDGCASVCRFATSVGELHDELKRVVREKEKSEASAVTANGLDALEELNIRALQHHRAIRQIVLKLERIKATVAEANGCGCVPN